MQVLLFLSFMQLVWPWMPSTTAATVMEETTSIAKPDCRAKCGDVAVPYPFGIDDISCAMNKSFLLKCDGDSSPAKLILGKNVVVRNISVDEGTMVVRLPAAYDCYNVSGSTASTGVHIRLAQTRRFSDTRNKLTAIGCDTVALMKDRKGYFGRGSISLCKPNILRVESCSGFGCSQTSVPPSLHTLNISISSQNNHRTVLRSNPCGYAFLSDERSFNISRIDLSKYPYEFTSTSHSVLQWSDEEQSLFSNAVIEWVAERKYCDQAKMNWNSYACRGNTTCNYSKNGRGYRCECKPGYQGNPYIEGCQDINECKDRKKYPCHGSCKNTNGNYTCSCPLGMHGDGKVACQGFRVTTIASVIGAVLLGLIITVLIVILYKRRENEKNFFKNGGMVLKNQRIRIFKEKELAKATNGYAHCLGEGGFGSVYRGDVDNIPIAVKRPKHADKLEKMNKEFQQEIKIISQVNHVNVVKLIGLCLETKVPLLVYEYISNRTLHYHIHENKSKSLSTWKSRLKVAKESALALEYLHSLADPPIIHGDIKPLNILLDDEFTVKVSDFGTSVLTSPNRMITVPEMKGTRFYIDPEYFSEYKLTDKSDVYGYGVILIELLTGEKPESKKYGDMYIFHYFRSSLDINNIFEMLCFKVTDDEKEEVKAVAKLAIQCVKKTGKKRPTMKEVVRKLEELSDSSGAQKKSVESEHKRGESSSHSIEIEDKPKAGQPDTYSVTTNEGGDFSTGSV